MLRPFGYLGAAAAVFVAVACQDYAFEVVPPASVTEVEVEIAAAKPVPADILFVVDNSGSMLEEQQNLADNFNAFIEQLAGAGDYQIAVTTTDVDSPSQINGLGESRFALAFPFDLLGIDRTDCSESGVPLGCFRALGASENKIISGDTPPAQQISDFRANVNVGTCGSGTETGIEAAMLALDSPATAECNDGFLREEANLVLIFVSDEDDQPGAVRDVETIIDQLVAIKPANKIRAASIIGYDTARGAASNCNVDATVCGSLCDADPIPPMQDPAVFMSFCHSCSYYQTEDCCAADAGARYDRFMVALERRIAEADPGITRTNCQSQPNVRVACLMDSICQEAFAETLEKIAKDLVFTTEYVLDPPTCNPDGVRVDVGGERLSPEHYEIIDGRLLRITEPNFAPQEGDDVQIFFISDGCGDAEE